MNIDQTIHLKELIRFSSNKMKILESESDTSAKIVLESELSDLKISSYAGWYVQTAIDAAKELQPFIIECEAEIERLKTELKMMEALKDGVVNKWADAHVELLEERKKNYRGY